MSIGAASKRQFAESAIAAQDPRNANPALRLRRRRDGQASKCQLAQRRTVKFAESANAASSAKHQAPD